MGYGSGKSSTIAPAVYRVEFETTSIGPCGRTYCFSVSRWLTKPGSASRFDGSAIRDPPDFFGETNMAARTDGNAIINRRRFLGRAGSVGAVAVLAGRTSIAALINAADPPTNAKPDSVFNGVHIGCITYSYRGDINSA